MNKHDSRIFWVKDQGIAVGPCPLSDDMLATFSDWRQQGVGLIVSAQPLNEARSLGLENEETFARTAKLDFLRIPIPDHSAPPFTREVLDAVAMMAESVQKGNKVFVHCYAGIGRSPALAAAVLVRLGMTPRVAIQALRVARGIPVPETADQVQFIFDYAEYVDSEEHRNNRRREE